MTPDDVADCILWAVTRPPYMNVDEIVIKPLQQASQDTFVAPRRLAHDAHDSRGLAPSASPTSAATSSSRRQGLFAADTRFLSRLVLTINGERPLLLSSAKVEYFSAAFFLRNPLAGRPAATTRSRSRGERFVGDGMQDHVVVVNHARRPRRVRARARARRRLRGHLHGQGVRLRRSAIPRTRRRSRPSCQPPFERGGRTGSCSPPATASRA